MIICKLCLQILLNSKFVINVYMSMYADFFGFGEHLINTAVSEMEPMP